MSGLACCFLLVSARAGHAQGFMVKPLIVEARVEPGEPQAVPVEVRNTAESGTLTAKLFTVGLRQDTSAGWEAVAPPEPGGPPLPGRSCLGWMEASPAQIEVPPLGSVRTTLTLHPPRGARGTYCASLVIQRPPPPGAGLRLGIQFLVPVLVHVRGPRALERVESRGASLQGVPKRKDTPGTTVAGLDVANTGETMARLSGSIAVFRQSGKTWKRVLEVPLEGRPLLPGMTATLRRDLQRSLPTGRYRLVGLIAVGGRARARVDQELDFQGDPSATHLAVDAGIELKSMPVISAVPASRRFGVLTVRNPGEETVTVRTSVEVPRSLQGVALGEVDGLDFTCAPWVTDISPQVFELRPGSSRNVRFTIQFPADIKPVANYYADVRVAGAYGDGQSAGDTSARMVVKNSLVAPKPVVAARSLEVAEQEENKYVVTAQFENHGNTALTLTAAKAGVLTLDDLPIADGELEGAKEQELLPLGHLACSALLDLSRAPAGTYFVVVTLEHSGLRTGARLPVKIDLEGQHRIVTVLKLPATPAGTPAPPAPPEGGQP